jgi:rhodanese-related sulfurtransferase
MAVGRFLILSLAGAAVWAAVGLGAGFLFAPQVGAVLSRSRQMSGVLVAALGTALLGYLCYKGWERHRFYQRLRLARIEVGDLYRALESGRSPLIVDARSLAGRQLQPLWIPTAIHAPIGGMERGLASASRDQDVVFYCSCPDEGASARVARQLLRHGFKRVRLLQGGLEAWTAAGYPVQSIYEIPHAESPATDFVFMDQESRAALASRFNATTYRNTAFRR